MGDEQEWDADAALARCPGGPLEADVWRAHRRARAALDWEGYRFASGRFHRGMDLFSQDDAWPALYTSLGPHIAMGEFTRHIFDLSWLTDLRLTGPHVQLSAVVDCRDLEALGVPPSALLEDLDFNVGQRLATATRFPEGNLVIFPHSLQSTSHIEVVAEDDPHLYVER